MTTIAVIQARMGSTRLPGKVLMDLGGIEVLAWVVRAARKIARVDKVVVATSVLNQDDPIQKWCIDAAVTCHRGPELDVLARFAAAFAVFRKPRRDTHVAFNKTKTLAGVLRR